VLIYTQTGDQESEIMTLLKELKPEGLAICTWAGSESEADRLIEKVEKMFK
jgi:hypothetical protein